MAEVKKCPNPLCNLEGCPRCGERVVIQKALAAQAKEIFEDILTPKIWYSLGAEKGFMIPLERFNAVKKKYGIEEEDMANNESLAARARDIFKDLITPKISYLLGAETGFMINLDRFNAVKKKYGIEEEEILRESDA